MTSSSSTFSGHTKPDVILSCGDVRKAFLTISVACWMLSLLLICQMAVHSANQKIAGPATTISTYFSTHTFAFMAGPVIICILVYYFYWSRIRLTWIDGLLIDNKSIDLLQYQFKRTITGTAMIYLQTANSRYILYAATSQDGKKLPDGKLMEEETAENERQLAILKSRLESSTATEQKFRFFSYDVYLSVVVVLLTVLFFWSH